MFQKLLSLAVILTLGVLVTSCNQATAPEPEKPKGILRITTIPTDMPITVDGEPKGNSPSVQGNIFKLRLKKATMKSRYYNLSMKKKICMERKLSS